MKNILVPVDLSPVSSKAIQVGSDLSKALSAKLWLVHVAAPEPDLVGLHTGPKYIRQHLADVLRQEHKDLQKLAETLRASGVDCTALLIQGPTTETLLSEADHLHADMIVMGSHGHGAFFKALVGSTTEEVLRGAKVPVVVVPSEKE